MENSLSETISAMMTFEKQQTTWKNI